MELGRRGGGAATAPTPGHCAPWDCGRPSVAVVGCVRVLVGDLRGTHAARAVMLPCRTAPPPPIPRPPLSRGWARPVPRAYARMRTACKRGRLCMRPGTCNAGPCVHPSGPDLTDLTGPSVQTAGMRSTPHGGPPPPPPHVPLPPPPPALRPLPRRPGRGLNACDPAEIRSCLAAALGPHLCICPLHASPLSAGGGDDSGVSGAERHASHGHASTSAPAAAAARQGAAGGRGASTQAPLQPQHHPAPTPVAPVAVAVVPCPDDITSLAWIAFARPRRGGSGGGGSVFGSVAAALEQGEQELMQRRGAAGGGLLVCLLAGTSSGWLQLHDEAGAMLLRQHLHAGPLRSIHCRTWRMGEEGAVCVCVWGGPVQGGWVGGPEDLEAGGGGPRAKGTSANGGQGESSRETSAALLSTVNCRPQARRARRGHHARVPRRHRAHPRLGAAHLPARLPGGQAAAGQQQRRHQVSRVHNRALGPPWSGIPSCAHHVCLGQQRRLVTGGCSAWQQLRGTFSGEGLAGALCIMRLPCGSCMPRASRDGLGGAGVRGVVSCAPSLLPSCSHAAAATPCWPSC